MKRYDSNGESSTGMYVTFKEYMDVQVNMAKLVSRFLHAAKVREEIADKEPLGSTTMCHYGGAQAYRRSAAEIRAVLEGYNAPDDGYCFLEAEEIERIING